MSSLCVTPSMTSGDWGCGGWGRGPAECIGGEGGTRCKGMVACMSGGGGLGVQSTGSGVGSRGVSLSGSIGSETESLVRLNLLSEVKRGRHIVSGDWLLLSDDSPRSFSCRRQPAWCLHYARRFPTAVVVVAAAAGSGGRGDTQARRRGVSGAWADLATA
jgi:hypothetical protein